MKHDLKTNNFERKVKRIYAVLACTAMVMMVTAVPALAADDPLTVVNNLSEFIFSLIRAIGLILLGFGILQVGLSLKSHDPSQRANGMLTVAGGIVITFTKEILTLILIFLFLTAPVMQFEAYAEDPHVHKSSHTMIKFAPRSINAFFCSSESPRSVIMQSTSSMGHTLTRLARPNLLESA